MDPVHEKLAQAPIEETSRCSDIDSVQAHILELEGTGTNNDKRDMVRMGKTQELRRNFRTPTIFAFAMVLMATWETMITANVFGLTNGGKAGLIWVYLGTFIGFLAVIISMAEMASMAPTAGGQYHWVSELAPRSSQKFLSYVVGWLCVLGWQVGNTAIAFLAAGQIQGLAILNNPTYIPQRWHSTLLVIAVMSFSTLFNTVFANRLPLVEACALIIHLVGFFVILGTLWGTGGPSPPSEVFASFTNGGNWSSQGLSCLVGTLSPIFSLIGPDSASHMSEELRDASKTLPRVMIFTALVNGAMGLVMTISFCFMVGDIETILASPTGQPYIQVFFNATGSYAATSILAVILIIMVVFCCITNVAVSSRQLFAFARDKGVPFHRFFAHVYPGWSVPLNAILFSYILAILLALINIGSTVAFNIVTSLGTCSLMSSYIVSISCLIVRRITKAELLPSKFDLGAVGLPLNVFSVLFLALMFLMTFFPSSPDNLTPVNFNWNVLVYGSVVVFSIGWFWIKGRNEYDGPVEYTRKSS